MARKPDLDRTRIGLIGFGSIGRVIAEQLEADSAAPRVVGVLRREPCEPLDVPDVDALIATGCNLVVEAAARQALMDHAVPLLDAGIDIIALSASALADPVFERSIASAGPGVLHLSTGAVGGLDIIRAMRLGGTLDSVSITSTTVPGAVADVVTVRESAESPVTVAHGTAREVSSKFPRVTNVAAMLAVATLGMDRTEATLLVDPTATRKRHVITASAGLTKLEVTIDNTLSSENVATSSVTAFAALRSILDWDHHPVIL